MLGRVLTPPARDVDNVWMNVSKWESKNQLPIAACVLVLVTCGAVIAAVLDPAHAPAWVQLIPSSMALGGVFFAYLSVRINAANRRDDESGQARLLVASDHAPIGGGPTDHLPFTVTLKNLSTTHAFPEPRIVAVSIHDVECLQVGHDIERDLDHPESEMLLPGHSLTSRWVPTKPGTTNTWYSGRVSILYTYMDASGRRWVRLNSYEPQRQRASSDDKRRTDEFLDKPWLALRGPGRPVLPDDIRAGISQSLWDSADPDRA